MYLQITLAERHAIAGLRRAGLNPAGIAEVLGRHRSTIGRELRRNRTVREGYRPRPADWYARDRRSRSRRNQQFTAEDWGRVYALVREDWSPEQIAGRLKREKKFAISHETIYRAIWADKEAGGTLYQHLPGRASNGGSGTGPATAVVGWRASD